MKLVYSPGKYKQGIIDYRKNLYVYIFITFVVKMNVLIASWLLLSFLFGISIQQCTIKQFQDSLIDDLTGLLNPVVNINEMLIFYNCLSPSISTNTGFLYSSMSVSVVYSLTSQSCRYNLQCNNGVWDIVGKQSTALRNNNTRYCEDCTDQNVNVYHCTG